ncbi:MAG: FAD-binding oxidoreductase [Rhodospirillaceae bacterium]|nr:FAD-binding oxidoreductase [Rhodospirillaceae bacterium]
MSDISTTEAIVIGAGIAGASTAFHLAGLGVKTTLLEREHPASGPSGNSTACCHAFYLMPELSQLAARGTDLLRQIPELTGEGIHFQEIGLAWAVDPDGVTLFGDAVDRVRAEGTPIESLPLGEFEKLAPDYNWDGVAMTVWEPSAGYIDPYSATNAFARGAGKRGVELRTNSRVRSLIVEGGRIAGVELEGGARIAADIVVSATGVWTKPLIAQLGVDLPLTIERATVAVLDAPGAARKYMPFMWADNLFMNYSRPEGEDALYLGSWPGGGTGERNQGTERGKLISKADGYSQTVSDDESVEILETFLTRMPKLAELGIKPGHACVYDMSPDDMPIIDKVPEAEGLFVVCGSSGHGFKLGPAVGEAVANFVTSGKPGLLAPFSLQRFAD